MSKAALRIHAETHRQNLKAHQPCPSLVPAMSARYGQNFFRGKIISSYFAFRSEWDNHATDNSLRALGAELVYPRVVGKHKPLVFHSWNGGDWELDKYGTKIPPEKNSQYNPDILLIPLLAYDKMCFRLGYGGGYYDRTLAYLRAQKQILAWGVAFSGQMVDSVLPLDHDQRLDNIITELGFLH